MNVERWIDSAAVQEVRSVQPPRVTGSKSKGLLALLAAFALVAAACGSDTADIGPLETTTIRYLSVPVGFLEAIELADELGYLGELQIEEVGSSFSGPELIQAVATGQTDLGTLPFNGATIKAVAAGAEVTAVIAAYGINEVNFQAIYALEDGPIESARDLIGGILAVNALGAYQEAFATAWLADEGLTEDEIAQVELVALPPASVDLALREGQIDAEVLAGTRLDAAVSLGGLRRLVRDVDLFGPTTLGSDLMLNSFIAENPNTTRQLVSGIARAICWAQTSPHEDVIAMMKVISENHGRSEEIPFWDNLKLMGVAEDGGVILEEEFARWIPDLESSGAIAPGSVDTSTIFTNEFNPYTTTEC